LEAKKRAGQKNSPAPVNTEKKETDVAQSASSKNKAKSATVGTKEADPKKIAKRAKEQREHFYKEALPETVKSVDPSSPASLRMTIIALGLSDSSARFAFGDRLSIGEDFTEKVLALPESDLLSTLQAMSLAAVMDGVGNDFCRNFNPKVRHLLAAPLGIDLATDFVLTEGYLKKLTIPEIIQVGEEPGVDLWNQPEIIDYRDKHFKDRPLRSLKKTDLVDLVLKSGVSLKGRAPQEILKTLD
jgi:hypothetical protein